MVAPIKRRVVGLSLIRETERPYLFESDNRLRYLEWKLCRNLKKN